MIIKFGAFVFQYLEFVWFVLKSAILEIPIKFENEVKVFGIAVTKYDLFVWNTTIKLLWSLEIDILA